MQTVLYIVQLRVRDQAANLLSLRQLFVLAHQSAACRVRDRPAVNLVVLLGFSLESFQLLQHLSRLLQSTFVV